MTATRMLRGAGLALAAAIGLVLLGSPAFAADTPAAVGKWFAQDAPRVAGDVLGSGAVNLGPRQPADGYRAGSPVRLHSWNPGFVSDGASRPVLADDEWAAALYRNGSIVGTIAATVSPTGEVAMSYIDDDAVAGTALASGAVTGEVVRDSRMGGLVEVKPDLAVRGLSRAAASTVASVHGTADLRKAVAQAHDARAWKSTGDDAGAGTGAEATGGDGQPLVLALSVGLAGFVLWLFWRRGAKERQA